MESNVSQDNTQQDTQEGSSKQVPVLDKAVTLSSLLNPARAEDETFDEYKARRKKVNQHVAHYLKHGKRVR